MKKNLCAWSVVMLALGLAAPALADEFTVNVEGRQGPFPVDEAGSAGISAVGVDYQVTLPVSIGGGGGGGAGKPQHKPVVIRKLPGASSLFFYEALVRGEHLPKVTIAAKKKGKGGKGQQEYLIITMEDVIVTSYSSSGSDDDKPAVEEISFVFEKIQLTHPPSGKQVTDSLTGRQ
jgi:type VI secretion system Hcp family effector